MGHATLRIVIVCLAAAVFLDTPAQAGTALLSRESTIRATGKLGDMAYNLMDGSREFAGFSDVVGTGDGTTPEGIYANQHSTPAMRAENFVGAYAEGAANASVGPQDVADATSNFDLTFEVLNTPAVAVFGGAAGVAGSGTTTVTLTNQTTGEEIHTQQFINADSNMLDYTTTLVPGVYALNVAAAATGESSGGSAFYTMSLDLTPVAAGSPGTVAIPLPPAVWAAGSMLAIGGVIQGVGNLRRRRLTLA